MKLNRLVYALLLALIVHGFSLAQEREVKGTVRDSNGLEMLGVAVVVKGEAHGTETNLDGKYTIRVADGKTLEFSFLGMKTKRFKVNGQSRIDVVMEEEAQQIDEVVVMGYGTARKVGTVVGSVGRISQQDIEKRPTTTVADALQGKVAGVQIFTNSGEPSSVANIRIHGVGSLGSSSAPLYIVDGVAISSGGMLSINPNDIESVSVLKDASATSIYGSRAANGVVYITTKRGKLNEKGEITVSSQYGYSNLANRDVFGKMMNADELASYLIETRTFTPQYVNDLREKYPHNTRWDKVYFREDIPMTQIDLSVSGGNAKTRYYISGGFHDQQGIMYRSGFKRYTVRSNIDSKVNDWLKIGINANAAWYEAETNSFTSTNLNGGLGFMAYPFYSPVDENGNLYDRIPGLNHYHPKYLSEKLRSRTTGLELIPTAYLQITPVKNLTFKTQAGMQFDNALDDGRRMPSYAAFPNNGTVSREYTQGLRKTLTNTLEYKFSLLKKHNFVALLGQESLSASSVGFSASGEGVVDDNLMLLNHAPDKKTISSTKVVNTVNSVFGRVEYDFNSKYFLDFSLRRDGSSKFGTNYKYANFWAAGAMWRLKREKFLENVKAIDDLTIKFSTGTSGNSEIGNYTHLALAGTTNQYNNKKGYYISNPGNPNLTWEDQTKHTLGVTAKLFNRSNIEVEVYRRITTNMLMSVPTPYTTGFSSTYQNVGKLQNQGIDVLISVDVYKNAKKNIYVSPYINFNYNANKVLALFQGRDYWYVSNAKRGYVVGESVKHFYPIFKGINPDNGDAEWYLPGEDFTKTQKDDSKVTNKFSDALVQNTGYERYAPFNGGFGLSANYKTLSLNLAFAFSQGGYTMNRDKYFTQNPTKFLSSYNQDRAVMNYWKKPGDQAQFPRWGKNFMENDSRLYEESSFIRLKTATLSYALSPQALKQVGFFNAMRFYVTGRNILTWTKYTGVDPEIDNMTLGSNPNTKQYVFGVELKF